MLGGAEEWFYRGLGGINFDLSNPTRDQRITIHPYLVDGVAWVKSSYQSTLGEIESNWKKEDGMLTMDVTIPAGATASVWVPANQSAVVMEGTTPATKATGIAFVRRTTQATVYRVGSGSYHFRVK